MRDLSRREFAAAVALLPAGVAAQADPFAVLEQRIGGRVGVAALHTGSGERLGHRGDERFAMCSTFKWTLAAAVLAKVDAGALRLDQPVRFTQKDLLGVAPTTRANVRRGAMTLAEMCEAAVEVSDNTAANLLLKLVGNPAGLTRFLRETGDQDTRLDRTELGLNTNLPNDPRDTTTPLAMIGTMQRILLGNVLKPQSRDRLIGWMKECRTGLKRLRAGLPAGWPVGDKTGTGGNNANNDFAIAWPPGNAPILIVSMLSESQKSGAELESAHAEIGRVVAAGLR